jgi:hypothetical protein
MTDLQETEARLYAADNSAHAELRKLRTEIDTVATDDVAAYAEALGEGQPLPKAKAAKLKDRIRDLELRVIPAVDEAMWRFAGQVREALRPDADDNYRSLLDKNLKRWDRPNTGRPDQPAPEQHATLRRPTSIVSWVEAGVERVDRQLAEWDAKAEREERKRAATRAVDRAQSAYNSEQRRLLDEREAKMTPLQRNNFLIAQSRSQSPPWPDFDRRAFLEREGLLEDYEWVHGNGGFSVKGGRSIPVEQVPASELAATNATEA